MVVVNSRVVSLLLSLSSLSLAVLGRERCELLQLSALLAVQFGMDQAEVATALKPTVSQLAQDPTIAVQERAKVCAKPHFKHTVSFSYTQLCTDLWKACTAMADVED